MATDLKSASTTNLRTIDRDQLKGKLDKKEKLHVFNVLSKEYHDPNKMIPGSKWVPVDQLEQTIRSENIDKSAPIVTYCAGGKCDASRKGAEKLSQLGFTNVSAYEGGTEDWEKAGFGFEKPSIQPQSNVGRQQQQQGNVAPQRKTDAA